MVDRAPCPNTEPDAYVDYVSRFGMPVAPQVAAAAGLARVWFKPRFVGLENLPDKPALFIGNHAFMAIDAALFHLYLYYDHGRYVKGLGDKSLFANLYYASVAHAMGGVSGQAPIVSDSWIEGMICCCTPAALTNRSNRPKRDTSYSGSSAMALSNWQRLPGTQWYPLPPWDPMNITITLCPQKH